MRCVHHSAFWMATFASSLFGFATFLPLWLGRMTEGAFRFYALWYQLLCQDNSCSSLDLMFQNGNVDGNYGFELIVLPMCALIAAVCSFVGVIILEILSCDCGRKINCNPRPVIVFCTILFWITAVFSGLTVFVSAVVCFEFYQTDTIDHAGEFPWCTLMFGIGFLLMGIAAVLFTVIVCRWNIYGPFYGYIDWRTLDYVDNLNSGSYHRTPSIKEKSRYSESIKRSYLDSPSLRGSYRSTKGSPMPSRGESKKVPGFWFAGSYAGSEKGNLRRSDYENKFRSSGDGSLFDFKLRNSKKASSVSDLRESKKRPTIHDSPAILRKTHASDYIREERSSLRESKKLNRAFSMDEIDPKRLKTGNTAYREARADKMEVSQHSDISPIGSRSEMSGFRNRDTNILDVLYRESRKMNV